MADIKQSIQKWCALQERSSYEVTQKLILWNIDKKVIPQIINELREENFLNDERFAEDYARGKFRIKNWGKIKIRLSLQQKKVSSNYIDAALDKIDQEDYFKSLQHLANKKNDLITDDLSAYDRKIKLYQFLLSKGFENKLVREVIEEIIAS
jgi:regulatory protein